MVEIVFLTVFCTLGLVGCVSQNAVKDGVWPSSGYVVSERAVFVDNEAKGRSGHMGHALVDCGNGRILDFTSNCAGTERFHRHSGYGWITASVPTTARPSGAPRVLLQYSRTHKSSCVNVCHRWIAPWKEQS